MSYGIYNKYIVPNPKFGFCSTNSYFTHISHMCIAYCRVGWLQKEMHCKMASGQIKQIPMPEYDIFFVVLPCSQMQILSQTSGLQSRFNKNVGVNTKKKTPERASIIPSSHQYSTTGMSAYMAPKSQLYVSIQAVLKHHGNACKSNTCKVAIVLICLFSRSRSYGRITDPRYPLLLLTPQHQ